jgi:hypothetical protein
MSTETNMTTATLGQAGQDALGAVPAPVPVAPPTTATDVRDRVQQMAEMFAIDNAGNQMHVLLDDAGLYRHLRFKRPDTFMYHFDLITWPGHLYVGGDVDDFVFARVEDMFAFFRGDRAINPHYWSEKVTTGGRRACKEYTEESLHAHVADILRESEEDWPGVTAAWAEHVEDWETHYEGGARDALNAFSFPTAPKPAERLFRFSDAWEWDLSDWTWGFLRACYAIQWGIAQYDAAKAEPAAVPA